MISVRSAVTLTFDEKERVVIARKLSRLYAEVEKRPDLASDLDMEMQSLQSLIYALEEPRHT